MIIAGQALAVSWSPPVALTNDGFGGGIVRTGSSSAAAVYDQNGSIIVKRTTNSGDTWFGPVTLSTNGIFPEIAGRGQNVDVVWPQGRRLRYARSTNGGASFSAPVRLSPRTDIVDEDVGVARGPNGMVAVVWLDAMNPDPFGTPENRLRIRISTNGGVTFGKAKTLAKGVVFLPAVAIGKGVIYFAYVKSVPGPDEIFVRRSRNGGSTWSAPTLIADNAFDHPLLTAAGRNVYVSYSARGGNASNHWPTYRRSTDKGANWDAAVPLSSPTGKPAWVGEINLFAGVVRVAFERCTGTNCANTHVFYRESANGTTWTPAEQVSTSLGVLNWPTGVAYAGRVLVGFDLTPSGGGFQAFVRPGTP